MAKALTKKFELKVRKAGLQMVWLIIISHPNLHRDQIEVFVDEKAALIAAAEVAMNYLRDRPQHFDPDGTERSDSAGVRMRLAYTQEKYFEVVDIWQAIVQDWDERHWIAIESRAVVEAIRT